MNQRDLELLSAYLDGQLSPSDSTRLEARLQSDRELVSVLDDLRAARTLLRQLPQRRAPRNFTLTRKMVGLNPPLPREYPAFRFATVVATLLFFFTFGVNTLAPQFQQSLGFGMGGGAEPETFSAQAPALDEAVSTEAPAIAESAATEAFASDLAPLPTAMPSSEGAARVLETPATKVGEAGNEVDPNQPQVQREAQVFSSTWQIALLMIAGISALFMVLMRRSSISHWK